MEDFLKNVVVFDHPLIQHKFTHLCDVRTGSKEFCEILTEMTALMGYEVLKDLRTKTITVQGPVTKFESKVLDEDFTIVPILRAGLGMVDGLRMLLPTAKVGHIGLYRDEETLVPHKYYFKMPEDIVNGPVIIVDPALATGGSAVAAVDFIKELGCKNIKFMCILSSEIGIKLMHEKHPEVTVYTAKYAPGPLNEKGYIYTSFGDAGDRVCGTCSYKFLAE